MNAGMWNASDLEAHMMQFFSAAGNAVLVIKAMSDMPPGRYIVDVVDKTNKESPAPEQVSIHLREKVFHFEPLTQEVIAQAAHDDPTQQGIPKQ